MKKHRSKARGWLLTSAFLMAAPSLAVSNPSGAKVASGQASISTPSKNELHIKTGDQAVINWKEFSIEKGELTKFIQPSKHSAVLNRVVDGNPSAILGTLEANGKVFLINPNGVFVGKDGVVNTASFTTSTLDLADEQFLQKGDLLFSGDSKAAVVNYGTINAWDGDVALIGFTVDNQGTISAQQGTVALGAGQEVVLKPASDEKLFIRPQAPNGERVAVGVNNTGNIVALQTELKADGNPYSMAINHKGNVDALNVQQKGGRILLVAEDGFTEINGSLNAPAGEIKVLGKTVHVNENARIDASSDSAGGNVYVGGGIQGQDPSIYNSLQSVIEPGAVIHADAKINGDGGQVVVWSSQDTFFQGEISAQGADKGNGGFVEVSGKNLAYKGTVNTSAADGKAGTLLLDPTDITIQDSGVTTNIGSIVTPDGIVFFDSNFATGILTTADLEAALAVNNVRVTTQSAGPSQGDIIVDDPVNWLVATQLTLEANRDIILNARLFTGTLGETSLIAGRDLIVNDGGGLDSRVLLTINSVPASINVGRDAVFHFGTFWRQAGSLNINAGRHIKIDEHTVFLLSPGIATASSYNFIAGGEIKFDHHSDIRLADTGTIQGENFVLGHEAKLSIEETPGQGFQSLTINSKHDTIFAHGSQIDIKTRGDSRIEAGHDILLGFDSKFTTRENSGLFFIAGHSIIATGPMTIDGGLNSRLTLVSDNVNPASPEFGTGAIIIPRVKFTASGWIRLYSSERHFDDFCGARFNGVKYKGGREFVNTDLEEWGVYFPHGHGGHPYKSFYKVEPLIKPIDNYYTVLTEPFQRWREFDRFQFGYDLVSFGCPMTALAAKNCTTFRGVPFEFFDDSGCCIFDERLNGAFNLHYCHSNVYRNNLYLRTTGPIDWVSQRPWCCTQ